MSPRMVPSTDNYRSLKETRILMSAVLNHVRIFVLVFSSFDTNTLLDDNPVRIFSFFSDFHILHFLGSHALCALR